MSAVAIITSLYSFGTRFNPKPYMPTHGYYTLELAGDRPVLAWHDTSIDLPVQRKHGSPNAPWYGYDAATYALSFDTDRGTRFYEWLADDLRALGLNDSAGVLRRTLEHLDTVPRTVNPNGSYTLVKEDDTHTGLATDGSVELDKRPRSAPRDAPTTFKISKSAVVVPTVLGMPIIHAEAFRSKFDPDTEYGGAIRQSHSRARGGDENDRPTHLDIITNEPCIPVSRHHQVKGILGTAGWAPLFSAKFNAYAYYRPLPASESYPVLTMQKNGENFPVSEKTSRIYTLGLDRALKIPVMFDNKLSQDTSFVLWPETSESHPILHIAKTFFGYVKDIEESASYWTQVATAMEEPDAIINVMMVRGSKGRIAVLNFVQMHAVEIQAALLRLHRAFQPVVRKFAWETLRLKGDASGKSVIESMRAPIAWAILTGTDFPAALSMLFGQVLSVRPMGSTRAKYHRRLHFNIAMIAAWAALLKGQPMPNDDNETNTTLVDENWPFQPELHPSKFFDLTSGNTLYLYGIAIGLAEFLPVYYFRREGKAIKHRGEEWPRASHNPKVWLGSTISRFAPYVRRFAKEDLRGRVLWKSYTDALVAAVDVTQMNRPISPNRLGDAAQGYTLATKWAEKFFYSKYKAKPPTETQEPAVAAE